MTRAYAPLRLAIWQDDDFLNLNGEAQRIYFVINSQSDINYAGVVPYMPSRWAKLAKNTTPAKVKRQILELVRAKFVVLDEHTEELWVRTFIKHNGVLSSPNLVKAMKSAYENVRSTHIKQGVYRQVPAEQREGMTNPFPPGSPEGLAEPLEEPLAEPFGEGQGLGSTDSLVEVEPEPEPEPSTSSSNPEPDGERCDEASEPTAASEEEDWLDILTRWRVASLPRNYDMRDPAAWRSAQRQRFLAEHGADVAAWLADWPAMPAAEVAAKARPALEPSQERIARVISRRKSA